MSRTVDAEPAAKPDLGHGEYLRFLRRFAVTLVVVGLVARIVRYAVGAAVWGDEAMLGYNLLNRDFAGLTETLDWNQIAPLLFVWAEKAVLLTLGGSEWAMRLLPFLTGVAGLFVFWSFARRVASPTAAALAVGLLAVSRVPVQMGGALKPYSGDLFWSAALLALAVRWRQQPDRLWPLALLAVVVPLALGFSYPTVFVAGGVALYLLPVAWRSPGVRAKALYALYSGLMVGTFAGTYLLVSSQKDDPKAVELDREMKAYWAHGFPPRDPVDFGAWVIDLHTGRMLAYPLGEAHGASTLSFLLFLGGVWRLWRTGRHGLLVLCLAPFALNFIAAVLDKYPYAGCWRLTQHLAPAICLLIGVGWADLHEWVAPRLRTRVKWLTATAVFLGLIGLGQVVFDIIRPDHDEPVRAAKKLYWSVAPHLRPGDRVVFRPERGRANPEAEWYAALVLWYIPRLDDRALEPLTGPPGTDTRRVWVVVVGEDDDELTQLAKAQAVLGPAWELVVGPKRFEVRPEPNRPEARLWYAIGCFARAGDPVDRPKLQP